MRLRTWRVWTASARASGFPGATPRPRSPAPRTWPRARGGSGHRRGGGGGAHPADEGDTTTSAAAANLEAVDVAPTAEDPAECVTDKGYHSRLVRSTTAPGRAGSPSPSRMRAGTEMMRLAGRSPTTGPGCYRGWPGKPSSCAPRSSSAPLPTLDRGGMRRTWLRGRENVHKRYLLSPATTYRSCANSSAPAEGGRGGRNWRLVRACYARWSRPVQIVLIPETAFAAICFAVA